MGIGRKRGPGGGGASLNFAVKAYPSEAELLAAVPKENTIGIITTTPITSWIFSAAEPEPVVDGMVWIPTGLSGNRGFNALKKNGIQVYPNLAMQYINGAWENKATKIYQNGEWEPLAPDLYLYDSGNEFADVTGGLKAYAIPYASSGSYSEGMAPVITRNTSSITIKHNSSYTDKSGIVRFGNKIDLSNYRTLKFDGTLSGGRASIYIWSSIGSYYGQNYVAYKTGSASGEISVDIPAGAGECYVGFGIDHAQTITLKKLWLEA